jgi:hypothetical protein
VPLLLRHAALIEKEDASVFLAVAARPHLPSVTRLGEEAAGAGRRSSRWPAGTRLKS